MTQGQSQVNVSTKLNTNLLTINEFAKICGTTPRTLRFYEQKGLFKPIKIDSWNNYRYYHPSQARDFFIIKLLQNFHLPLSQIKSTKRSNGKDILLGQKLESLASEIEEKQKEYNFLKNIDEIFKNNFSLKGKLKEESFGPYTLLCTRIEGEYKNLPNYIKELWKQSKKLGIKCRQPEIVFYLEHIFNPKKAKFEIALICSNKFSKKKFLPEGYHFKKFPKTKIYTYKYVGPFQYLNLIYEKLYAYMDKEKLDYTKGGVLELSIRGPLNTKSPYDYLTKLGYYLSKTP